MLVDIADTMDEHVKLAEELFSAAKTEFKHPLLGRVLQRADGRADISARRPGARHVGAGEVIWEKTAR